MLEFTFTFAHFIVDKHFNLPIKTDLISVREELIRCSCSFIQVDFFLFAEVVDFRT